MTFQFTNSSNSRLIAALFDGPGGFAALCGFGPCPCILFTTEPTFYLILIAIFCRWQILLMHPLKNERKQLVHPKMSNGNLTTARYASHPNVVTRVAALDVPLRPACDLLLLFLRLEFGKNPCLGQLRLVMSPPKGMLFQLTQLPPTLEETQVSSLQLVMPQKQQ